MRRAAVLVGLAAWLALGVASRWWSPPFGVSLRLEPRPAAPARSSAAIPEVWRLEVTQTFPGLEGLAVGDRVQFDRYGVLAPAQGSVQCLPAFAGPVQVTPIGGRITHAGHLHITRAGADAPGCEPPARPQPVVSLHP